MVVLEKGMDFRKEEYREEVFQRFYEFHLKYRSHPGAVYYMMPYLAEKEQWDTEAKLWFAYLNGNTQNPVTSYILFTRFPEINNLNLDSMADWFYADTTYLNLQWDTDRRYHKKTFLKNVENYQALLNGGSQEEYFGNLTTQSDDVNFENVWDTVSNKFESFGRLSTFSYLEYLRIMGINIDCNQLFLDDMQGSKSHRNGLCKVIGRDDLDWHASNPNFDGNYSQDTLKRLEAVGEGLLSEAKRRSQGKDWDFDVSYFTLESALCTYKSWHRKNRRYPNVYNDLFYNRIKHAEERWINPSLDIFWQARKDMLPPNLRQEDNPRDKGCTPIKQNHYRLTGQVIMMEKDWECFENDYSRRYITA